jgi:hypothetical protein
VPGRADDDSRNTAVEEGTTMDLLPAIFQNPLTAFGVAGFLILQLVHLSRWAEHHADMVWWRGPVEDAAAVYLRATGKNAAHLEAMDIDQIAAAAGCRTEVAERCLRDLYRHRATASR